MRHLLKTIPMLVLSFVLGSCGDEEEGRITLDDSAPGQVADVVATSVAGGVSLSWINPSSSSFMYNKVAYTNAKGEDTYVMLSKEHADSVTRKMTTTFSGFVKTEPVKFLIYACSVRGNNSGAVEVSGTPGDPNFVKVLSTITVDAGLGGITVGYDNPYDETVIVGISYQAKGDASRSGSAQFEIAAKSKGSQFVRLLDSNDNPIVGVECDVTVHTEDAYDNASDTRSFSVTPKETKLLDRSGWTFPGYNASSSAATIGYSSQEAVGEGATNGRVMCMLDGNTSTIWHSQWKGTNQPYPHWFIIDMGEEHTIASIEITGRLNNVKEQKGHQILVCSDANATNKSNPDSWTWEDMGEFSFDPASDKPQNIDLTSKLPKARYIKVYIGTKFKGSGSNAMISELNVYAAE